MRDLRAAVQCMQLTAFESLANTDNSTNNHHQIHKVTTNRISRTR
jgi:hypothetical protein